MNFKAGKILLYVMGMELPTMASLPQQLKLCYSCSPKRNFTLALFSALTVEMVMAIHISDSVVFYILIFLVARISNSTVLLGTNAGNQKNISS